MVTGLGSALVVDDEFLIAELLSVMLEDMGIPVCDTAATADEALALAEEHSPGLVLMDVRLQGAADGIDAAAAIRLATGAHVIFITGSTDTTTAHRIAQDYPATILYKPVRLEQLRSAVGLTMA